MHHIDGKCLWPPVFETVYQQEDLGQWRNIQVLVPIEPGSTSNREWEEYI